MRRAVPGIVLATGLAVSLLAGITSAQTPPDAVVGERAPTFYALKLGGGDFQLSHWSAPVRQGGLLLESGARRRHAVVVSLFATWCVPCRSELPELDALRQAFGEDLPLLWWAMSVRDQPDSARVFLERLGVQTPALSDRHGYTARKYAGDPARLPTIALIDPEGILRYLHHGYRPEEGLGELAWAISRVFDVPVPEQWAGITTAGESEEQAGSILDGDGTPAGDGDGAAQSGKSEE